MESPASRTQFTEPTSTVEQRRRLQAKAKRARLRGRLLTIGAICAPMLLALIYLAVLVAPQYMAESRFSVQATQPASSPSSASSSTSLLTSGGGLGAAAASGFVDGWAVQDFLNSRDCMRQLDRRIGLRNYLAKAAHDPLHRLGPNAGEDGLFSAYQNMVHNSYNMIEQINVLKVDAFSPADSKTIATALLSVVEDFVQKMNQQGIADAVKVSEESVRLAQRQDQNALAALASWRAEHGNVDPTADASMLMNQVGLLEASLSAAQVNLDNIKALHNPNHPMLQPAQWQVDSLTARLNDLRARMSGQSGANTSAALLRSYAELTNAQTFADGNLLSARQNYQQAYTNALALQRYLSIIANPVAETRPSVPNPFVFLIISFAVGCGFAAVLNLTLSLYRSLRHV